MADLATLSDFQSRYERTLTDVDEMSRVRVLITDASALVCDVADSVFATVPATVVAVVCEVVRRAFDNPTGLQGETIGDYTWRGGKATVDGGIYLTAQERRTVRRAAGKVGVSTLTLTGDLPIYPSDSRLWAYTNEEGVLIVNAPEPEDL
jgi:hypothetical protein